MRFYAGLARWSECFSGQRAFFLLPALLILACQAPRSTVEVEAPTEELQREIAAIAEHIVPELEERFGVRSVHLRIVYDPVPSSQDLGGESGSFGIRLYPIALPWLTGVLAHEIAHVLLHWRDSHWNTLPILVEEGMAYLLHYQYCNVEIPVLDPELEEIARDLLLSHEDYRALESKLPTIHRGVYIAQRLELEQLRELAVRARRDGLEEIPAQWILDALSKVEQSRKAEGTVGRVP